jgi:hypothetical protein
MNNDHMPATIRAYLCLWLGKTSTIYKRHKLVVGAVGAIFGIISQS